MKTTTIRELIYNIRAARPAGDIYIIIIMRRFALASRERHIPSAAPFRLTKYI